MRVNLTLWSSNRSMAMPQTRTTRLVAVSPECRVSERVAGTKTCTKSSWSSAVHRDPGAIHLRGCNFAAEAGRSYAGRAGAGPVVRSAE
jgi:hypothetical protein